MSDDWTDHVSLGAVIAGALAVAGIVVVTFFMIGYELVVAVWGTTAAVPAGAVGVTVLGLALVGGVIAACVATFYVLGALAHVGGPRLEAWYEYLTGGDDNP